MAKAIFSSPKHLNRSPSLSSTFLPSYTLLHPYSLLPFSIQHPRTSRILKTPGSSNFRSANAQSRSECPVPIDQLPINEYRNLSNSFPFSWATADLIEYSSRLLATGLSFALFLGLPVSWFGSDHDSVKLVLGSVSTGLFAVTLAVIRMYLGWAYVGNRLLSATVQYEETGWYDGQIWVKTAEVLARDRLLGSSPVKMILGRLKDSLVVLAISLFVCATLLVNYEGSPKDALRSSNATVDRVIAGVYNEESARTFEPHAFCGAHSALLHE